MPGIASLQLLTPAAAFPSGYAGPINAVTQWSVRRELSRAGQWTVRFPVSYEQVSTGSFGAVKTGWLASIVLEGVRDDIPGATNRILSDGRVTTHALILGQAGEAQMELSGQTKLGSFGVRLSRTGSAYTGSLPDIAADIASPTYTEGPDAIPIDTQVTFNDQTKLANLIKIAEFARSDLRELVFPGISAVTEKSVEGLKYIAQDDRPDCGFTLIAQESAGYEQSEAAANGFALIGGVPTVIYNGEDIINLISVVGVNADGSPLYMDPAQVLYNPLYVPETGTNPDASEYAYLYDPTSAEEYGLSELNLIRSDIKADSTDPLVLASAQLALYAIAAGELLKRRSEIISFGCTVANGENVWCWPGDAIKVRYAGVVRLADQRFSYVNLDMYMVVMSRTDSGNASGVRSLSLELAAPVYQYQIPDVISIPTPDPRTTDFPDKKDDPKDDFPKKDDPKDPEPDPETAPDAEPLPVNAGLDDVAKKIKDITEGNGAYSPCCADPTTDLAAGAKVPIGTGGMPVSGGLTSAAKNGFAGGNTNVGTPVTFTMMNAQPVDRAVFFVGVRATNPTNDLSWQLLDSSVNVLGDGNSYLWAARLPAGVTSTNPSADNEASPGVFAQGSMTGIIIGDSTAPLLMRWGADADNAGGTFHYRLDAVNDYGTVTQFETPDPLAGNRDVEVDVTTL